MRNKMMRVSAVVCAMALAGCAGKATVKDASNSVSYSRNGTTVMTSGSAGEVDLGEP